MIHIFVPYRNATYNKACRELLNSSVRCPARKIWVLNLTPSQAEKLGQIAHLLVSNYLLCLQLRNNSFKKEHLTNTFVLLEQADRQNTLSDALTNITANMSQSGSGPQPTALSTLLACPRISHHNEVDVQSREHSPHSLAKSFKSTVGPSDDILPRQILSGEHTNKAETTANANFPVTPENSSETSPSHMIQITTPPGNFTLIQSHSASDLSIHDQETPIIVSSLALSGQIVPSLEETGTGSIADHYGIPSSSPPLETESNSYFIPATIFRAHNPVCQYAFPRREIFSLL